MDTAITLHEQINNARAKVNLPVLSNYESDLEGEWKHIKSKELVITDEEEGEAKAEGVDVDDYLIAQIEKIVTADASDEKQKILFDPLGTHLQVSVASSADNSSFSCQILVFYRYLGLDPLGPLIDGSLAISGSALHEEYSVSYCMVQHAEEDAPNDFKVISALAPSSMIITRPSADDGNLAKFTIPISVPPEYSSGVLNISLYADKLSEIPEEGSPQAEEWETKLASTYASSLCAVQFSTSAAGNVGIVLGDLGDALGPELLGSEGGLNGEDGGKVDEEKKEDEDVEEEEEEEEEEIVGEGEGTEESAGAVKKTKKKKKKSEKNTKSTTSNTNTSEEEFPAAAEAEAEATKTTVSVFEEEEEPLRLLEDVKIATDYEEQMTLHRDGYELSCITVTKEGVQYEQEQMWKQFIMAKYTSNMDARGVEDVTWVKCLKSLGALPTLIGYTVNTDYDLSEPEHDYSVYLAVKIGSKPLYRRMHMISCSIDDEEPMVAYIQSVQGFLRPAPPEMAQMLGGPCGMLLMSIVGDSGPDRNRPSFVNNLDMENEDKDEDEDEDEDSVALSLEETVADLQRRVAELKEAKVKQLGLNAELQKKAVSLVLREKQMQGQSQAARTAAEAVATVSDTPQAAINSANIEASNMEQTKESERQYSDVLILIEEERLKLVKLNREFDQLALDLQTRLDDKEFKANGITESFKAFKREILAKAENSRTGHAVPKAEIEQLLALEQKREEDLERIRLKNISLRTMFRKLERTLRAREQLAEGLHMIDFEQLKIENQTLTEKIEERSEELVKLKRKKTTNVQILSHVREKLRFMERANQDVQQELALLETELVEKRNAVTLEKLNRDSIRHENKHLKAKQGFASSDLLLVDFERRTSKVEEMRAKVSELKDRYNLLMDMVNRGSIKQTASAPRLK